MYGWIGSLTKSWTVSLFFCGTISRVRLQRYRLTLVFHTGSRAFTNQNVANLVAFRM